MKYTIISGSNRKDSGSRKASDYIKYQIEKMGGEVDILDMYEVDLPIWKEEVRKEGIKEYQNWQKYSEVLQNSDAFVIVAAEWDGAIPPSLQNFLMHTSFKEFLHKPAVIVSVVSGINGAYPISFLKSYSTKNNGLLYTPDHVIVRHIKNVLSNNKLDEENENDFRIKERINFSLKNLDLYAKHMKELRKEGQFNVENYPYGM